MAQATTWLRQSYLLLSPPASSSLAAARRCSPLLSSSTSAAPSLLHSRRTNPSLSIPATLCSSSNSSFSPSSAGPKTSADLHLHNTFTKRKEPFRPRVPGKVGMYVCGITAYDLSHIGHARVSVVFDVLYRYLKHLKYDVIYVRNFTDVDDKR